MSDPSPPEKPCLHLWCLKLAFSYPFVVVSRQTSVCFSMFLCSWRGYWSYYDPHITSWPAGFTDTLHSTCRTNQSNIGSLDPRTTGFCSVCSQHLYRYTHVFEIFWGSSWPHLQVSAGPITISYIDLYRIILDIWIEPGGHGGSCVHHGFPVAGVSHVAGARDLSRLPRPWRRGHRAVTPGLHRHRVLAPQWGRGLRGGQGAAAPGSGGGSWREKPWEKPSKKHPNVADSYCGDMGWYRDVYSLFQ